MNLDPRDPQRPDAIRSGEPSPYSKVPPAEPAAQPDQFAAFHQEAPLANLGNLAQNAREKPLRHARGWLIFLGIGLCLLNAIFLVNVPNEVKREVENAHREAALSGQRILDDRSLEAGMYLMGYLIYGIGIVLGIVFLILASLMLRFPLATTIASLALFIVFVVGSALLNPANLLGGIIVKIIVLVVLINAIKAAVAYEREKREDFYRQPGY